MFTEPIYYRSISPWCNQYLWYGFWEERNLLYAGRQIGLRNSVQNRGVEWFLPMDLVFATRYDTEPWSQVAHDYKDPKSGVRERIPWTKYFGGEFATPPSIEIPPDEQPDEEIPPVTTEPYAVAIEDERNTEQMAVLVGCWPESGLVFTLFDARGSRINYGVTGAKGEHNRNGEKGGSEFGMIPNNEPYSLEIGPYKFTVPGGAFVRLSFKIVTQAEEMVKLITEPMDRYKAEHVLIILNSQDFTKDLFHVANT